MNAETVLLASKAKVQTAWNVEKGGGWEVDVALLWWCLLVGGLAAFAVHHVAHTTSKRGRIVLAVLWVLGLGTFCAVSTGAQRDIATHLYQLLNPGGSVGWWLDFPAWPAVIAAVAGVTVGVMVEWRTRLQLAFPNRRLALSAALLGILLASAVASVAGSIWYHRKLWTVWHAGDTVSDAQACLGVLHKLRDEDALGAIQALEEHLYGDELIPLASYHERSRRGRLMVDPVLREIRAYHSAYPFEGEASLGARGYSVAEKLATLDE